jgi:hypothetical protein
METPYDKDFSMIIGKISSRSFSLSFLESFTFSIKVSGEKITAAATTGPASGPLPASSTPAINLYFSSKNPRSKFLSIITLPIK